MHLYLAFFLHRDYFGRLNASLSCSFPPQGLFRPAECISILLFCSTGIISTARIHLYLALLLHRDYFVPVKCISIWLFCSTGIISAARIHLYLALLLHRDYFNRPDSSLSGSFVPQRLFQPPGCIPVLSNNRFSRSYHKRQQKRGPNAPAPVHTVRKIFSMCLRTFRRPLCQSFCRSFCAHFFTRTSLPCSVRSPSYP